MPLTSERIIVLRFRDIELPLGDTIVCHKRVIAERGYCWWGWLYRGFERNPHRELRQLGVPLTQSPDSGMDVALFDTGRGLLFQARCVEIRATPTLQRSPQPAATPGYYNDRRAPAWFRFTDIHEMSTSRVIGRICVDMPSASEDCFVDLLGQVVTHLKDLRRQEVTLWVLG